VNSSWIGRSRALFASRRKRVENGRLVYYHVPADQEFWETQWKPLLTASFYAPYLHGELGELDAPFTRFLPRDGEILEAGCGTGQVVAALRARQYDCVGVDYAEATLAQVREILPTLPLSMGDVTHLDTVQPGAYSAVISLGVAEHRREGPEPFLDEAWRILQPGGRLLISVPWFNTLRRWKHRRGAYRSDVNGLDFYQYAYSPEEFRRYLNQAGFRVIAEYPYGHYTGLAEDVGLMEHLERFPLLARGIYRASGALGGILRPILAHMRLYVAEKKEHSVPDGMLSNKADRISAG
jgi:SAM-dependent methyltransferase